MNNETRPAWASFWIALAALLVTVAFSATGAWLSLRSLQTQQSQLAIDQQPMVLTYCTFPLKGVEADYIVSLNSYSREAVETHEWFKAYNVPRWHSYADCKVQNFGRYPLIDLLYVLDVDFLRVGRTGASPVVRSHLRRFSGIEGVSADGTEDIFVVNDDPCNQANIGIEGGLDFLNTPYRSATHFQEPGRRSGWGSETYILGPVSYPANVRRFLEGRHIITPC